MQTPESTITIIYLLLSVFILIIAILITRWIFGIPTIVKNNKAQTELLAQIALKHGVDPELIHIIIHK